MENPSLFCSVTLAQCDPDHYSRRYRGTADNGGVHHNSGVANQAFYLLAEGGVNRTSGRRVTGLGAGGREKAERVFYRGFTTYLTPSATFRDARRDDRGAGPLRRGGGGRVRVGLVGGGVSEIWLVPRRGA
jgi:thermolysin